MVTFVGTQDNFVDALKELIELDYASVDAYDAAIERLESSSYQAELIEFRKDHERHIEEISTLLKNNKHEVPEKGTSPKQVLATGKVLLANMLGDNTILQAMKSNEIDTNTAYERMNEYKGKWPEAEDIIKRGLKDEQRHMAWLEKTLSEN